VSYCNSMSKTHILSTVLTWLSGLAFICYGSLCLVNGAMTEEFKRYGLTRFRKLVGFLEVLGGIVLLIGMSFPPLLIFSSAGLTLLMLLGVIVRIRIKDSFILILPALILMLINTYIFTTAICE
jgi:hypothetical protein